MKKKIYFWTFLDIFGEPSQDMNFIIQQNGSSG